MSPRSLAPLALSLAALFVAPTVHAAEPVCAAPWNPAEKHIDKGNPTARTVRPPDLAALPPAAPLAPGLRGAIRRVDLPPGEKLVALTFDLCETSGEIAGYDGAIVEELRRRKVPTTFFVGGHWSLTHPGRFGEIAADPLFEIANHTWSHANLRTVDDERLKREVLAPEAAFHKAVTGPVCPRPDAVAPTHRSTLFRFPFGACDARSMAAVNDAGMAAIQWDVSTGDPSPLMGAKSILEETLRGVRPGSIVLAHANGRGFHTSEALPQLLDALEKRGYRFVTVSELLARGRPVVVDTCYDARPGDTDKYDKWAAGSARKPSTTPLPAPERPFAEPAKADGAAPLAPVKPKPITPATKPTPTAAPADAGAPDAGGTTRPSALRPVPPQAGSPATLRPALPQAGSPPEARP